MQARPTRPTRSQRARASRGLCLGLGAAALAAGFVAPFEPATAGPQSRGWDYHVTLDEGFREARVEICFRRFLPKRLVVRHGSRLAGFDLDPPDADGVKLEARPDGSVVAEGLAHNGCVRYRVALDDMQGDRYGRVRRIGRDILTSPGALLLRPGLWPSDVNVTIRLSLPAGTRVAAPWPERPDGRYHLDRYALQLDGMVAFGHFAADSFAVGATTLDVAVLDGQRLATRQGIHAWLRAAVKAVAKLYGKFPAPHVTAIIQPVPSRGAPVVFGTSMRAGGGHVHLMLSSTARDEDLPGEWVAIHEMTHLGMPWTYESEAWLQEGFVTYYQEVLRTRAGFQSELEGWQRLHDGFRRGRRNGGRRSLAEESTLMGREHNYHRVYWAGAAMALLIDLELRDRTDGRRTLDDVMRMMYRDFGGTRAPKSGVEVLERVDRWLGESLCTSIAHTCLRDSAFPSLEEAYAALGLEAVDGLLVPRASGAQVEERARIMRTSAR